MTGNTAVDVLLALAMGVVIWRVAVGVTRLLATPPPAIDPEDVVPVNQDYHCSVCGAEVTMKVANVQTDTPPKHCREEMIPVWRPE